MNGLKKVFGDDILTRIKSCEFHFKESRNRMARKLGENDGEEFKGLCDEMLVSSLKETYLNTKAKLEHFIQEKAERQFLVPWLNWWDSRRSFIFNAFSPKNAPKMNLGDVVHAGWSNRDSSNLLSARCSADRCKRRYFLGSRIKSCRKRQCES